MIDTEKQSKCSKYRNENIKKSTKYEKIFAEKLNQANIKYMAQKGFIAGNGFCIADFYLPKPFKIVIEIDGEYHQDKKQTIRDQYKDEYYKSRGFKVVRIQNKDVIDYDVNKLFE